MKERRFRLTRMTGCSTCQAVAAAPRATRNARMGARPWVGYAQYEYASMLAARDKSGDLERALELLSSATETARELGMAALWRKMEALRARAG